MIRWDTANDTFELGQWFRGRIYEQMSDLSDDGELLLYVARKGGQRTLDELGSDTWTAISRPPYVTALALWPHAGYCGGGVFSGHREALLYISGGMLQAHAGHEPQGLQVQAYDQLDEAAVNALAGRRNAWRWDDGERKHGWQLTARRERTAPDGVLQLIATARPHKVPRQVVRPIEQFVLRSSHGDIPLGDADFVDFDQRGRVVLARGGELWLCDELLATPLRWRMLADFSAQRPQTGAAPQWATVWP
ncbi:hypothetical protein IGB42_03211 [Andreprevotia sp. IGB-42]|nr:hypothetical protein IGB42_03211 [Andreprevotia sp. IGB-42]